MFIKFQIWELFSGKVTGCLWSYREDSSGHWFGFLTSTSVWADFESLSLGQSETICVWSPSPELYDNAHAKPTHHPCAISRLFLAGAIAVHVSLPN